MYHTLLQETRPIADGFTRLAAALQAGHSVDMPDHAVLWLMPQPGPHQGIIDGCIALLLGLHLLQPEELLALQLVQLPL